MKPTVDQIRQTILQLAVRGQLVPQDPSDEPASELLKQIEAEKQKLIADGTIRKQKKLPDITEDEIPFEIPDSWEWVRLGVLGNTTTGTTPKKSDSSAYGSGVPFIKPANIIDGDINYSTKEEVVEEKLKEYGDRVADKDDILMVCIGTIGKTGYVNRRVTFNQQINSISPYHKDTSRTLYYWLLSEYFQKHALLLSSKATVSILNKTKWSKIGIPLPPLQEQERIVKNVDELMALCDKLEDKSCNLLQVLNQLRQTILQLAVRGQLVPQDPADEPASELLKQIETEKQKLIADGTIRKQKKLPQITDDETPFEIPESWDWIKMGNILELITDGSHHSPATQGSGMPYITVRDINDNFTINTEDSARISQGDYDDLVNGNCKPEPRDVLFSKDGTVGKTAIARPGQDFVVLSSLAILRPIESTIKPKYLNYALNAASILSAVLGMKTGVAIRRVVLRDLKNLQLPIPPEKEQQRIVEKVDELMALCDRLEHSLRQPT